MIGYYVHHMGQGHAQRAEAITAHLRGPVTALSSLPRPAAWSHEWLVLPRDDDEDRHADPTAGERLHWAPLHHRGLQSRMAALANWITTHHPSVLVVDLSVEVTVLARLLGVPVVTTALPGARDDAAHHLGFDLADTIIAPWPDLDEAMCPGLDRHRDKVHHVGGLSRFDGRAVDCQSPASGPRVLALDGAGGTTRRQRAGLPQGWRWVQRGPGNWVDDPWPDLCAADVVVTHCGLGAVSDVAAARRPAVLLPEQRPHEEQFRTARALAEAGLGVVLSGEPQPGEWEPILSRAMGFDPARWSAWSSGDAAARSADIILRTARRVR